MGQDLVSGGHRAWARDSVACPEPSALERVRDSFFELMPRLMLGLIQARGRSLCLGPFRLLSFGAPRRQGDGWCWDIVGGLLARHPGGQLCIGWRDGRLFSLVQDYRPLLPRLLYDLTQLPFHHAVTRQYLLRVRGRVPSAGIPAQPARRLVAGALDLALCGALAAAPRRRPARPLRALALAAAYHVVAWSTAGRTLGGLALGLRVAAVDGSRPTPAQALVRLLALPLALVRRRARHDEIASTDVLLDPSELASSS